MEDILRKLKEKKPNLSHTTLKTYGYVLNRLLRLMKMDVQDYEKLVSQQERILQTISHFTPATRKTILAVLVSLFSPEKTQTLRKKMMEDIEATNAVLREQKKTKKQEENWMTWKEVEQVYKDLYKELGPLLNKQHPTQRDQLRLVDLIMLAVFVLIPPRRSQDYTDMKIRNYNINEDNYFDLKKGLFVFNKYKTQKTYGEQKVKLPKTLLTLLKKWIKINDTDWLLFDSKKGQLPTSRLTLKLNNIFDKRISSSMLRHIFLSSQLEGTPTLTQRDELAEAMGHSAGQAELYRKV